MSNMTAAAVEAAAAVVEAAAMRVEAAAVDVAAAGGSIRTPKLLTRKTRAKKCHKVNFIAILSHS
jgi:hypothetical protein